MHQHFEDKISVYETKARLPVCEGVNEESIKENPRAIMDVYEWGHGNYFVVLELMSLLKELCCAVCHRWGCSVASA